MPKTDAGRRANAKWDAAHMAVLSCKLRREIADSFKEAAAARGMTPAALMRELIDNYLEVTDK